MRPPTRACGRIWQSELLEQIKGSPPNLFERLVVELLVKMGYGGSRKDAGRAIGRSGDEGIDGIIKEDRLGLDIIYVQAKRWASTVVGRPEIHKFAGALQGQRGTQGRVHHDLHLYQGSTGVRFDDRQQDCSDRRR